MAEAEWSIRRHWFGTIITRDPARPSRTSQVPVGISRLLIPAITVGPVTGAGIGIDLLRG